MPHTWQSASNELHTCVKGAIWDEEGSNGDANQHKELEEPEAVKKTQHYSHTYNNINNLWRDHRVPCWCLATRGQHSLIAVVVLRLQHKPVLDGGPRVLAAAHSDHDEGEEEEEAGHGEAHAVNRLVAYDDVAVHRVLYARYGGAACAKTRNLAKGKYMKQ